jgi:hypothetical protein
MYNLTVDQAHTFFVGEGRWLVHNCSTKLNRALGGVAKDGLQAHHLIPEELASHAYLRRITGWDHDGAINGILLPDNQDVADMLGTSWHRGSHDNWTQMVNDSLNTLERQARSGNWSPEQAWQALVTLLGIYTIFFRHKVDV